MMNAELVKSKPIQFIELPEVMKKVRLGKTAIYRRIANKKFPQPIKMGRRKTVWAEHEIDTYMLEQMAARPETLDDEL